MSRVRPAIEASSPIVAAFQTKLGWMAIEVGEFGLRKLVFDHPSRTAAIAALRSTGPVVDSEDPRVQKLAHALRNYAAGEAVELERIEVAPRTSAFQERVVQACRAIPRGQTRSYGQLAAVAGSPRAARAVGTVMSTNQIPLIVPCHRVIASNGSLGDYSAMGGLPLKQRLLDMERGGNASADGRLLPKPKTLATTRAK